VTRFPALVTALALFLYVAVFLAAGRARHRYNVKAPAVTGPPEFERAFRVQQNTVEQIVVFLPALWLFAFYVSSLWAGIVGLVWIGGRICYALSYYRDPEKRGPGFIIAMVASLVLLLGGLIGVLVAML
jgi:uncharacterized membrane protein YecN with MAPEG domain